MTSGVQGGSSNIDPSIQARMAQNADKTSKKDAKAGTGAEEAVASGFEEMIQETSGQKTTKKETNETSKKEKSAKSQGTNSTHSSSVSSASETATAQAVKGPKDLGSNNHELPKLPTPSNATVNGVVIRKNQGTLALLGLILTLLAQAGAKSWSADFQQQNDAIANQVRMAPMIGKAIRSQADAQAKATEAQAQQQLISGVVNLVAAGISVGAGVLGAFKGLGGLKSAKFTKETGNVSKGGSKAGGAAKKGMSASDAAKLSDMSSDVSMSFSRTAGKTTVKTSLKKVDDVMAGVAQKGGGAAAASGTPQSIFGKLLSQPTWKTKFSQGLNVAKVQGGRVASFAGRAFSTAFQASQFAHVVTAGIDGIVGSVYQSQVAVQQRLAGMYESQSAELQQMSSVYDKYAQQAQSLADKSQEAITNAMQTLNSIAESQTQTSSAIFN